MIPKITLVTGTYNRLPYLQAMMDSARRSVPIGVTLDYVVVDGGSDDGTLEWLRSRPDVTLIEHGALLGAKKAFCDGAKAATGEYVLIANDDVRFLGDGIVRALIHLENTPSCGGVAFASNHRFPNGRVDSNYTVQLHPVMVNGRQQHAYYAQVGLFPRAIGEKAGWWGDDDPDFHATSYGCDNYLSARVQEMGYTIDAVAGVAVHDEFPADILKDEMARANNHGYYERFPLGPTIPPTPAQRSDKRRLRILYLPIYEPGYPVQRLQKRGLRDALVNYGRGQWVWEVDYVALDNPMEILHRIVEIFKPDLILSQLHGTDKLSAKDIRFLRSNAPRAVWVNWNGDVYPQHLLSKDMLALLNEVDLQLVVNAKVIQPYSGQYIRAKYWQIGYEEPGEDLPDMPVNEVVWLANLYNDERRQIAAILSEFDHRIYQAGDEYQTQYDFAKGKAIYRNAKIAIGTNEYGDHDGFVSNRFFQAIAAGGALLLHQHIPGFDELTGIRAGKHYVEWIDADDLRDKIKYYLQHEAERRKIARAGTRYIHKWHSFEARVTELFEKHLPDAKRIPQVVARVRYIGKRQSSFGQVGRDRQYLITPGIEFEIDPIDIPLFERQPQLFSVLKPEGY